MEALNPCPAPMRQQPQQPLASSLASPPSPLLLGAWDLAYASNGTVVTRSGPAQLLLSASRLPGVGLADITQVLSLNEAGALAASNSAVFGLGPFGSWRVGIEGVWRDKGDGRTARVLFDRLSIKPVSAVGLPVPEWLPPLVLSMGMVGAGAGADAARSGADWVTSYLDGELRVGRGASGNTFLFRRRQQP